MFRNQKGFTLIEMLVVLMVISLLMLLILPNLGKRAKKVEEDSCKALIAVVQSQVEAYYLDHGDYPGSFDVLVDKNYLREDQKKCGNNTLVLNEYGVVEIEKDEE